MAVGTATKATATDEAAMRSVAAAMRDAATTASETSGEGKPSAGGAGFDAMQWLSRMTYTGSYVLFLWRGLRRSVHRPIATPREPDHAGVS